MIYGFAASRFPIFIGFTVAHLYPLRIQSFSSPALRPLSINRDTLPRSQISTTSMKYISADGLASLMKDASKTPGKDFLVVDVRDDDREGGHIRGAVHRPSTMFLDDVDKLVKETRGVPLVVFHCMLSQSRGPKAARIYREERDRITHISSSRNLQDSNAKPVTVQESDEPQQQVYILRDGFQGFQAKFRKDTALVEDWDRNIWAHVY